MVREGHLAVAIFKLSLKGLQKLVKLGTVFLGRGNRMYKGPEMRELGMF